MIFLVIIFCLTLLLFLNSQLYFKSKKWNGIKNKYKSHITWINETNFYINKIQDQLAVKEKYECSLSVLKQAEKTPFKSTCKHFSITINDDTLDIFSNLLLNYKMLNDKFTEMHNLSKNIICEVKKSIPFIVKLFCYNLDNKLNIDKLVSAIKYPEFQYVHKNKQFIVQFNIKFLEAFLNILMHELNYKQEIKHERSLMTKQLREEIKERDNYTCQMCGASIHTNPNIIFHIDHIIPVSRGGKTEKRNLQLLCESCNLHKSNKIYFK